MRARQETGGEPSPREPIVDEEPVDGPIEEADDEAAEGDEAGDGEGADAGDDEAGEAEGEEGEAVDAEPPPRRGGGSQTIRAQRARAQEAERRAVEAERQLAEMRGFQAGAQARQQQPDPAAAARAEQEFYQSLEVMPPAQAYQALMQRGQAQVGQALQQLQFNQQDLADQTRFEASCARSPVRESYRDKVEQYRIGQLRRGFIISREESFHLLYGKDLEERANKARPAQQRAAARRIAGQQTRPTGARSNMAPGGRRPAPDSAEADWAAIDAAVARGRDPWNL
jgi:hypothetical protein